MIEKFEVGKYYRFTGKTRPPFWNAEGKMDAVLDGKPRKCTEVRIHNLESFHANFEGIPEGVHSGMWCWATRSATFDFKGESLKWEEVTSEGFSTSDIKSKQRKITLNIQE